VIVDPLIHVNRTQVVDFAAGARPPPTHDLGVMARAAGVMAYALVIIHHYEVAVGYTEKILRRAKPRRSDKF
jgi:hypothetical protein